VREAIHLLKQKPCPVRIHRTFLKQEDVYEVINNQRIMQPSYLRRNSQKLAFNNYLERYLSAGRMNLARKDVNETFIF